MLQKHPIKNPLRGLVFGGDTFLHRCRSYGTQERFEVIKVSASYPVRLQTEPTGSGYPSGSFFLKLTLTGSVRMQVAFGRVRRKTEPTGLGVARVIFSKIDTYGAVDEV